MEHRLRYLGLGLAVVFGLAVFPLRVALASNIMHIHAVRLLREQALTLLCASASNKERKLQGNTHALVSSAEMLAGLLEGRTDYVEEKAVLASMFELLGDSRQAATLTGNEELIGKEPLSAAQVALSAYQGKPASPGNLSGDTARATLVWSEQCLRAGETDSAIRYLRDYLRSDESISGRTDHVGLSNVGLQILQLCSGRAPCKQDADVVFLEIENAILSYAATVEGLDRSRAYFELGKLAEAAGSGADAESFYRAAVLDDPSNPIYRIHLGSALTAQGHAYAAESELLHAIGLAIPDDDKAWAYGELGYSRLERQEYEKSLHAFRKAAELGVRDKSYGVGMARAYWGLGRGTEAIQTLDVVIAVDPHRATAWYYRSQFHGHQGNIAAALADGRKATELDPASVPYRVQLIQLLRVTGSDQEAAQECAALLRDSATSKGEYDAACNSKVNDLWP